MNLIQPYIDALLDIWRQSSPAGRVGILLMAILCCVAIGGVGYWSVQPSYVVLVSQTDGDKLDRVIDALAKAGIDYELSGAGGNLMVDKRDFAKARLLARTNGVSDVGSVPEMPMGGAFGSPSERRNLARMQQQRSLAATITKISIVEQADVHLNIPDNGPFERNRSTPSASVMLTLMEGQRLSDQQASSIASFVAYAVENLAPESVQITDKDGRSYSIPDERTHQIASQVDYIAQAERKLAEKAQSQLLQFLGYGNARVEVSLDMTFVQGSKTTTIYDKAGAVPNQEDLVTESTTGMKEPASGAAGVASNLKGSSKGNNIESKTENISTTYLVPVTEETQENSTPLRNFLSVSVVVNSDAKGIKGEDGVLVAGIDEKVTAIVKNAVGFRDESDTISVNLMPFQDSIFSLEAPVPGFDWVNLGSIIEKASLAIAALLAFVMGLLLLRRYQPASRSSDGAANPQVDQARLEHVNEFSRLIKDNPELFTQIVQSWSGVETKSGSGGGSKGDASSSSQRKAA